MAGAMSGTPSIALSYGVFQKPYAPEIVEAAHHMSCAVLQHLAAHIFDAQGQRVASDIDVYSINVPVRILKPYGSDRMLNFWRYSWSHPCWIVPIAQSRLSKSPPLDRVDTEDCLLLKHLSQPIRTPISSKGSRRHRQKRVQLG